MTHDDQIRHSLFSRLNHWTLWQEDLALELGATGDMLSSTRKRNLMLMKRVKYENKINCVLEDQLNKKTTRLTALSQYKHDNEAKHQEVLKNEIALRQQATWDAAEAKKQMEAMQKQLDIAEKRLSHHMEQETIRLKEEDIARDLKNQLKAIESNQKRLKAAVWNHKFRRTFLDICSCVCVCVRFFYFYVFCHIMCVVTQRII